MINAADAMKLIFSHPAATAGIGGLIGGSGALVYNAFSQPTLDEYGNPIESNDINPLVAAGIGSGVGLVGGMGAKLMTPQNNKFGSVYSQAGRQTPQEIVIDLSEESPLDWNDFRANTVPIKQVQIQNNIDTLRNEITDIRTGLDAYKQRVAQGYDDFRSAAIPIRGNESVRNRQPNPTAMPNPQLPSGFQEQPHQNLVFEYFDESPNVRTIVQDVYSPDEQYLYSIAGGKQFQNPDRLPKLIQTPPRQFQEEILDPVIGRRLENNAKYSRTAYYPDEFTDANGRVEDYKRWMQNNQLAGINPTGWNVVSADPEAARYQKWLESEAIIRNPQKKIV